MCDHKEKDHKYGKTTNSKPQQMKHHHQNQGHHFHRNQHQYHRSDDTESHDTHSTAEDSIFSDHHPDHRHQRETALTHQSHAHHPSRKQNLRHASLSETPLSSSTVSSSSPSSSASSSSSSSSSFSSSSSSSSSSSFSSSSSTSSSSLSSETSSDCSDRYPLRKPQHSQSCTDISGKHKYYEEGDDTAPLIDKGGTQNCLPAKQEWEKGISPHRGPTQGTRKNRRKTPRGLVKEGSVRKAKSMEALTGPKEKELHGNEDEKETERRKIEARKNLMKEKMKFSAFLNEITRQVLSPMRLTTLGVTDAQRPCSPSQASVRSRKEASNTHKPTQHRSRPASADSMSSSMCSHTSKHSTRLCHSKSFNTHHRHRTADLPHGMSQRPKSCTDISCVKRHSCSQTPKHRSITPPDKHYYHRHQGDHQTSSHHHHHGTRNSPSYQHHQHRTDHNTTHHFNHRHHHSSSPSYHHGEHHNTFHHHRENSFQHHHYRNPHHGEHYSAHHFHHHGNHHSPAHHHHHGDHHGHVHAHHHGHHHGLAHHHGDHHITTHHHHNHHHGGHHTPDGNHGDGHSSGHPRHSNHQSCESPTTSHLHGHPTNDHGDHSQTIDHQHSDHHNPPHAHHHGDHHGLARHHSSSRHHQFSDHHSEPHHHHHGNQHSEPHHHHHGDHHIEHHHHHHGDQHSEHHHHHHGDHHSPGHQQHVRDHHSGSYQHHHGDHHRPGHQHHDKHHSSESHQHHHGDHHGQGHLHHDKHHSSESHEHHHGDHHSPGHQHHDKHHSSESHEYHHGEHRSPGNQYHDKHHSNQSHEHHHGDHHSVSNHYHDKHHSSESHEHRHGDHHIPGHQHHEKHHSSESHQHHQGDQDQHSPGHQHHDKDHHSSDHKHHHGDSHSPGHQHHHGDDHSQSHHSHLGDYHSPAHQHPYNDDRSESHQHPHGDHHIQGYQHPHDDHSEFHQHHRGDHHGPGHQHSHSDHHNESHQHHQGDQHHPDHHHHGKHHVAGHQHPRGDQNSELSQLHRGDYFSTSNRQEHYPESLFNQSHSITKEKHEGLDDSSAHLKGQSVCSPHSPRKQEPLSSKVDPPRNSPSIQEEEQTSFTTSSLHKEKEHEHGTIKTLQEQNQGLHQSLLKTAVRMECLGEEFISSQKLLEVELQKTRMELSNLTERFKRLQENCSSTQQTNFLEQKLHSAALSMEGERERLNRRISALTEKLADGKFANTVETFNVTSVLHKTDLHFQSDDAINHVLLPIAPPPVEFMDNHSFMKTTASGQEQSLGSVPEEEESDWSEMGEETPRFVLMGSNRGQVWRHREGDMDKDSESGGEEIGRRHSPRPLQIPHLQFTIHNENLSDGMAGDGNYRMATSPTHGSAILIRSASLEEIPLARHHMQEEMRGTEAMMDLHHQGGDAMEDLDNEIIHHWRSSTENVMGRPVEVDCSLASLQSAERMLNHFICEPQPTEGTAQGRAEVHGWPGGLPDEVLKGERTQL